LFNFLIFFDSLKPFHDICLAFINDKLPDLTICSTVVGIVLAGLLRSTSSDYTFGIFKLPIKESETAYHSVINWIRHQFFFPGSVSVAHLISLMCCVYLFLLFFLLLK